MYKEFNYAPYRTQFDPRIELQQLQILLPTYKPYDQNDNKEENNEETIPVKILESDKLEKKDLEINVKKFDLVRENTEHEKAKKKEKLKQYVEINKSPIRSRSLDRKTIGNKLFCREILEGRPFYEEKKIFCNRRKSMDERKLIKENELEECVVTSSQGNLNFDNEHKDNSIEKRTVEEPNIDNCENRETEKKLKKKTTDEINGIENTQFDKNKSNLTKIEKGKFQEEKKLIDLNFKECDLKPNEIKCNDTATNVINLLEPPCSFNSNLCKKVHSRSSFSKSQDKKNTPGKRSSSEYPLLEPSRKSNRKTTESICKNDYSFSTVKIHSDSINALDKINRVDISENMEISLGNNDLGNLSITNNISPTRNHSKLEEFEDLSEIKKKPVQVDVENKEFMISPLRKGSVVNKLRKRLSAEEEIKLESIKKKISFKLNCSVSSTQGNGSDKEKIFRFTEKIKLDDDDLGNEIMNSNSITSSSGLQLNVDSNSLNNPSTIKDSNFAGCSSSSKDLNSSKEYNFDNDSQNSSSNDLNFDIGSNIIKTVTPFTKDTHSFSNTTKEENFTSKISTNLIKSNSNKLNSKSLSSTFLLGSSVTLSSIPKSSKKIITKSNTRHKNTHLGITSENSFKSDQIEISSGTMEIQNLIPLKGKCFDNMNTVYPNFTTEEGLSLRKNSGFSESSSSDSNSSSNIGLKKFNKVFLKKIFDENESEERNDEDNNQRKNDVAENDQEKNNPLSNNEVNYQLKCNQINIKIKNNHGMNEPNQTSESRYKREEIRKENNQEDRNKGKENESLNEIMDINSSRNESLISAFDQEIDKSKLKEVIFGSQDCTLVINTRKKEVRDKKFDKKIGDMEKQKKLEYLEILEKENENEVECREEKNEEFESKEETKNQRDIKQKGKDNQKQELIPKKVVEKAKKNELEFNKTENLRTDVHISDLPESIELISVSTEKLMSKNKTEQEKSQRKRKQSTEYNELNNKLLKVIDIKNITDKMHTISEKWESVLEKRLMQNSTSKISSFPQKDSLTSCRASEESLQQNQPNPNLFCSVEIKSEPTSDEEIPTMVEDLEEKRKYLSALNISEKPKTKTGDKSKFTVTDNISKVIDEVASSYYEIPREKFSKRDDTKNKEPAKILNFSQNIQKPKKKQPAISIKKIITSKNETFVGNKTTTSTTNIKTYSNTSVKSSGNKSGTITTGGFMVLAPSSMVNNMAVLPPNQTLYHTSLSKYMFFLLFCFFFAFIEFLIITVIFF